MRSCRAGFCYCVLIGRCDRSRCAPRVLIRWVATGRDACTTSRFVRMMRARLSVHGWGVVIVVDVRRVY